MKKEVELEVRELEKGISNILFESFISGALLVGGSSDFLDPKGTIRYEVYVESSIYDNEFVPLFSVVKYPKWYVELKDLPRYNIEGRYSSYIYDDLSETFNKDVFDEAKKQCSCEMVAAPDKPSNIIDYCDWYYKYLLDCASFYSLDDLRSDRNLILRLNEELKKRGLDYTGEIHRTYKNATGKDKILYELIKESL